MEVCFSIGSKSEENKVLNSEAVRWHKAQQLLGDREGCIGLKFLCVSHQGSFYFWSFSCIEEKTVWNGDRELTYMFLACTLREQRVKTEELGEERNCSQHFIHQGPSPLCGKLAPHGTDHHWSNCIYFYITWIQDRVVTSLNKDLWHWSWGKM